MSYRSAFSAVNARVFLAAVVLSLPAAGCSSSGRLAPSGPSSGASEFEQPRAATTPAYGLIHAFDKQDGSFGEGPAGGVILDAAGNIFGTTVVGGTNDDGVVFELKPTQMHYKIEKLHDFSCYVDGCLPMGSPAEDSQGAVFVNTSAKGPNGGQGTLVKLSPSGNTYRETGLYTFTGAAYEPYSTPLTYGNAVYTLTCCTYGILFGFDVGHLRATVLHTFGGADGEGPLSGVVESGGLLYGTTSELGTGGGGTVYSFDLKSQKESVLYSFKGGNDGTQPIGNVVLDSDGNIYGTTFQGGADNVGVLFKLARNGVNYTESILHTFGEAPDGAKPWSGLTLVRNTLWGTTVAGGDQRCDCGTIFSLETTGSHYRVRHTFLGSDGSVPYGTLVLRDGALYGTTYAGGPVQGSAGVVFRFVP